MEKVARIGLPSSLLTPAGSSTTEHDALVAPPPPEESIELDEFDPSTAAPAARRARVSRNRESGARRPGKVHTASYEGQDTARRLLAGEELRDTGRGDRGRRARRDELSERRRLWAEALRRRSQAAQEGRGREQGQGRGKEANMKFSHSLQFNAVPDWSAYYIGYSNLKKLYVPGFADTPRAWSRVTTSIVSL